MNFKAQITLRTVCGGRVWLSLPFAIVVSEQGSEGDTRSYHQLGVALEPLLPAATRCGILVLGRLRSLLCRGKTVTAVAWFGGFAAVL